MLGMVGQVVHKDYHIEFVRTRDHLAETPLRAELDEHQLPPLASLVPAVLDVNSQCMMLKLDWSPPHPHRPYRHLLHQRDQL
jgi:hypothetical protein